MMTKEEVNTGRQIEFDYLKGIFMLFIFLVHAFQATGSEFGPFFSCIYIFSTMSGAAIYIFVLGFGVSYSDRTTPGRLAKIGIILVVYQYLSNLLYVLTLTIPYFFVRNTLSAEGAENHSFYVWVFAQYLNIFFISGIIYLVLALLKKLRLPVFGYVVLAVIFAVLAPILYGTEVDIPVIGYITTMLIGEAPFVSFTPLCFISYALIGVAVGKMYRRIADKSLFYKRLITICIIIIVLWWISVFIRFKLSPEEWGFVKDFVSLGQVMDFAYTQPDLWHVIASLSHVGLFAGLLYFYEEHRKRNSSDPEKRGLIPSQFLFYSSHISKYYALHIAVDLFAYAMHGYLGFSSGAACILALVSMIVTEVLVRLTLRVNSSLSRKRISVS